MSVARATYRTLLRSLAKAQMRYRDANDICFAVFGVAVQCDELVAAAAAASTRPAAAATPPPPRADAGDDMRRLRHIARACFERASLVDGDYDAVTRRLSDAFAVIRALRDLHSDRRCRTRSRTSRQRIKTGLASTGPISPLMLQSAIELNERLDREEAAAAAAAAAASTRSTGTSTKDGSNNNTHNDNDADEEAASDDDDDDEVFYREYGRVYDSAAVVVRIADTRELKFDCAMALFSGKQRLLPYRYLLPPEPMYTSIVHEELTMPCITDVLLGVCTHAPAYAVTDATTSVAAPTTTALPAEQQPQHKRAVVPWAMPRTHADVMALLTRIPTRTRVCTESLEVEVIVHYLRRVRADDAMDSYKRGLSDPTNTWTTPTKQRSRNASKRDDASASPVAGASDATTDATSSPPRKKDAYAHLYNVVVHLRNTSDVHTSSAQCIICVSMHLFYYFVGRSRQTEMVIPGVAGSITLLTPNETHMFETGISIPGDGLGIVRGSVQVAVIDTHKMVRTFDAMIAPTRLCAPTPA